MKAGCMDRISEIMPAVYSLAQLDRKFIGFFRDDWKLKRSLGLKAVQNVTSQRRGKTKVMKGIWSNQCAAKRSEQSLRKMPRNSSLNESQNKYEIQLVVLCFKIMFWHFCLYYVVGRRD